MFLLDTNVVSELRKKSRTNPGVIEFFERVNSDKSNVFLSVITIGELRRGIEMVRNRGDRQQALKLEEWLSELLLEFEDSLLPFGHDEAQVWGKLRSPNYENAIDKQIAATAWVYDLVLVTRNTKDFNYDGLKVINPFT